MPSILIVEDETIVAADLAGKLGRLGYTVCGSTACGEDALALARERRPDLALMDIRLAGKMDGVEAAAQIHRECDIPVIYLTAHSDRATLDRAKRTEPFGFILKPFEERELETHIEMALYKHQAERKLRESEQRWATTLASIGDAVITSDTEGKVTFLNPVAVSLTGWTQAEALGQPVTCIFKIINEQSHEPAEDLAARVLHENRIVELANHTALVTRAGLEVPVEDSAAPITDASGRVTGVVIVFHDVTERRRTEEALAQLASFPQLNPNPIVEVDLAGLIHFCNPTAVRLFPELVAQGPGHPWLADWESVVGTLRVGEQREAHREVTLGDVCYLQTLHYLPEIQRIRIYGMDITERKEAERAKDQFLALLSHELQSPLTNILGWSRLALERQSAEYTARAMEVVNRNALRQKYLVDELLDMSRLMHRKIELKLEQTDGRTQIQQAVENVQYDALQRQITLLVDPRSEALLFLADPVRLQQCLGNLLHNSLKFTPQGGAITVSCRREGEQAVLSVHDTGRGIHPEALPTLFTLFRQVDRDERAGGLGLGLSVVRGIVELHGGRVWADSQGIGQGSTFSIALPLAE